MIVRIVLLFLVAMAVLAMFGRLRFPGQKRLAEAKCKRCGRYRIGKGPCDCEKGPRR
tara:strand:+ start:1862 stop:2032 length:171 start_codon:yes stop_codon:yes gene_type:complete